jgi:hypothetical protein
VELIESLARQQQRCERELTYTERLAFNWSNNSASDQDITVQHSKQLREARDD